MKNTLLNRLLCLFLGLGFFLSFGHIGQTYPQLKEYAIEYGFSPNMFGPVEGAFYLVYGLSALMAAILLTMAVKDDVYSVWMKISWSSIRFDRLAIFLSICVMVNVLLLRLLVIREAPMTDDESAYLFSARMLQSFKLYWEGYPASLLPFLHNQFLVVGNHVFTQYYPGFPALLALGLSLGSATLVNPILAGLGTWITFLLVRKVSESPGTAFIAALLLSLSPSYLFTSAMLLPHTASLVFSSLFLLMVIKSVRESSVPYALVAGVAWGALLFTRPLTAAWFGVFGAAVSLGSVKTAKQRVKPVAALAAAALVFCVLFLMYNRLLTGDYLKTTYTAFTESAKIGFENTFSLNQLLNGRWTELLFFPFLRMNFWTFGWASSFVFLFFCPPGYLRRLGLGVVLGLWLVHLSWPNVGVNMSGAAHYLEALPFIAMLTAAGLRHLLQKQDKRISAPPLTFAFLSALLALAIFFPWAARNLRNLAMTNLAPYQVESAAVKPAIIFSTYVLPRQGDKYRLANTFTYFRRNNRPDLTDDVLWLNDLEDKNVIAMGLFPGRHAYRLRSKSSSTGNAVYFLEEIKPFSTERSQQP